MQPHNKHIVIKYHQFWSFFANCDVKIQHIDSKKQITEIFNKATRLCVVRIYMLQN